MKNSLKRNLRRFKHISNFILVIKKIKIAVSAFAFAFAFKENLNNTSN
jgi:hypothetical protein